MDIGERIYVEFSPELKSRLNHRINLREVLAAAGIAAEVEWHAVPPTDPAERSKALVETVRAASIAVSLVAAVPLIESAITRYLDHQAVRDSHFGYWVNEPLLDKGRPVLDRSGQPLTIRRRISGFDELPAATAGGVTITVGESGVSVTVGRDDDSAKTSSVRTKVPKDR